MFTDGCVRSVYISCAIYIYVRGSQSSKYNIITIFIVIVIATVIIAVTITIIMTMTMTTGWLWNYKWPMAAWAYVSLDVFWNNSLKHTKVHSTTYIWSCASLDLFVLRRFTVLVCLKLLERTICVLQFYTPIIGNIWGVKLSAACIHRHIHIYIYIYRSKQTCIGGSLPN